MSASRAWSSSTRRSDISERWLLTTALFETSLLLYARNNGASPWMIALVALVTILPVCELALSFLNTILTTMIPPRPLPKLALRNGVPDELRTIVAVPTILSSPARVKELVDALEVRALANHDENLRFALLGDLPDADAETTPSDQEVIDLGRRSDHRPERAIRDRTASIC